MVPQGEKERIEEISSLIKSESQEQWFALSVVPRKEKATAHTLRAKGYVDFLPMYAVKRKWSDRMKVVEMPLFPGYVFCRFDAKVRLPILKIPTVMAVAGLGKTPQPIPDDEIAALQVVCKSGVEPMPCPYITTGAKVQILEGPLTGLEGILTETSGVRLVLSVTLLQRSISVEVDRDWIAPTKLYKSFQ